jgi:hypothetical protein
MVIDIFVDQRVNFKGLTFINRPVKFTFLAGRTRPMQSMYNMPGMHITNYNLTIITCRDKPIRFAKRHCNDVIVMPWGWILFIGVDSTWVDFECTNVVKEQGNFAVPAGDDDILGVINVNILIRST